MSFWMWYYHIQWRLQASFKQSCWINSNMILLVGTWKLHYSKKNVWWLLESDLFMYFKRWGFILISLFTNTKIRGEVVEVKGILREERENKEGSAAKCGDAPAVYKTPKDWGYLLHKLKIDYPENRWNSGCLGHSCLLSTATVKVFMFFF